MPRIAVVVDQFLHHALSAKAGILPVDGHRSLDSAVGLPA
jgi:hypothetical protein